MKHKNLCFPSRTSNRCLASFGQRNGVLPLSAMTGWRKKLLRSPKLCNASTRLSDNFKVPCGEQLCGSVQIKAAARFVQGRHPSKFLANIIAYRGIHVPPNRANRWRNCRLEGSARHEGMSYSFNPTAITNQGVRNEAVYI